MMHLLDKEIDFFKAKILGVGFLATISISGLTSIYAPEQTSTFAYLTITIGGIIGGGKMLEKIR